MAIEEYRLGRRSTPEAAGAAGKKKLCSFKRCKGAMKMESADFRDFLHQSASDAASKPPARDRPLQGEDAGLLVAM